MPKQRKPTDTELGILSVLWDLGPSTVRQVHEVFSQDRDLNYTTILKMLQTMLEKGLVVRDESGKSHIYAAALKREQTQKSLLSDLMERAFGGSARELVMLALQTKKLKPEEKADIEALLARHAPEKKP